MIWIIGLQRGCVGLDFEVTVILQRIRVPKKLEGREVDSRDVKTGTRRSVFDMIYLLTAIGLSPGGSTHLHTNST